MSDFYSLSITPEELNFYRRIAPRFGNESFPLPPPIMPPNERTRRRCAFRNQRTLHRRVCDLTAKPHVTLYSPGTEHPVYSIDAFWGDGWDASDYGTPYDSSRPFLDQLAELYRRVPRLGMMNRQCQNSEYCNYSYSNKNCYLVFSSHYEEDCFHGNCSARNRSCADYHWIARSELCYECVFSSECYRSIHLDHCTSCKECAFCIDCISCEDCLFCANLRHRQYCIFNEQLSKKEYLKRRAEYSLATRAGFDRAKTIFFDEFRYTVPFRAVHQMGCENCEGTDHTSSRNIKSCFQADTTEDTMYSTYLGQTYDCIDVNYMGFDRCELSYQCIGCTSLYHGIVCDSCWHCSELLYCSYCFSSQNCIGCLSLKRKEYCILNHQYTKAEYERLAPLVLGNLIKENAWGDFFPASFSPFGYNETVAADWYPLDRAGAEALGFRWQEPEPVVEPQAYAVIPENIHDLVAETTVVKCEESGRPFRITASEIELLQQMGVPLPRRSPDVRQRDRLKRHSPWNLWTRKCAKTGVEIETTFAPDCREIVHSVDAYLKEFY